MAHLKLRGMQVLNALAPCQQEQGDLSGAEAMLRSSVILAKHQQDLTSQVTRCQHPSFLQSASVDEGLHSQ